jgi:photosystem II stability/assembly factor-like uncharacterized protein
MMIIVRLPAVLMLAVVVGSACSPATSTPTPTASAPTTATRSPEVTTPATTATPAATVTGTPVPLPTQALLSAPSRDVVWTLVGGTRLFLSIDRGTTWSERQLPVGGQFGEIAFANDRDGLLLSAAPANTPCPPQQPTLWSTRDGGATWTKLSPRGIADDGCKTGPAMIDAPRAFLGASGGASAPAIYRTADGSATWAAATLPDAPGFASQPGASGLRTGVVRAFASVALLQVTGQTNARQFDYLYRSTDTGITWSHVGSPPRNLPVAFVTASRWLQIIVPAESFETTDAGATWHAFVTDYGQAAPVGPQVVFGDADVGYASVRGSIQRTTDGGVHWMGVRTPGT